MDSATIRIIKDIVIAFFALIAVTDVAMALLDKQHQSMIMQVVNNIDRKTTLIAIAVGLLAAAGAYYAASMYPGA